LWFFGIQFRWLISLTRLTSCSGAGLLIVRIPRSQPTEHRCMAPTAPLTLTVFGKLMRGNISSSPGYWFGLAILFALCAKRVLTPETAEHICLHCPFAQQVWHRIAAWTDGLVQLPVQGVAMEVWWREALGLLPRPVRRNKAALLIYTT
jgi:hypothetical protein